MSNDFTGHRKVNIYDFDGVITCGVCPRPGDIVVTGRGYNECTFVYRAFDEIMGEEGAHLAFPFYFNPKTKEMGRTREDSGHHKAGILERLLRAGIEIGLIFEDDPIQAQIIQESFGGFEVYTLRNGSKASIPELVFVNSYWTQK